MGIRELVSEFTTPYACCPPRVTNIRRAAEMLDGTIVPIGGRFSLNDALGQRTVDRGFVEAPQIEDGRLVDAVGGGVSQVATTMYNAAFFAGLELVAHTPHQFYISRYPMGREATVSWGGPELIFRNDWAAAILVKAAAADDGITIRLFSSRLGRRVETRTGSPRGRRPPKVVEVQKESLPPGTRTVVQPMGAAGFTVDYTRKVYEGVRLRRDEHFTWTYSAEDAIVEVGPPKEKPEQPERTDGPPGGTPPGAPPPPASPRPPAPPSPTSPSLAPPSPSPLPGRPGSSPSAPPLPGSGG
jgi:vancomycin resistance protein YoaR